MINASQITEHMEVVGSDGEHVGIVDHLAILLTKSDPEGDGMHHVITMESVASIDGGKVVLNMSAADAIEEQMEVDD